MNIRLEGNKVTVRYPHEKRGKKYEFDCGVKALEFVRWLSDNRLNDIRGSASLGTW